MNRWTAFLLVAAGLTTSAAGASDEREKRLGEQHRKWLLEEVPYIISKVERETFLNLETEDEREALIRAFWRKRDSNPSTEENEFREEHYKRLAYVNEFFGRDTFRPGWMTDRGKFYITLGPPTERQNLEHQDAIYPCELWFYNNPELKQFGLPPFFYLLFFRRNGAGELMLYSPVTDGPPQLITGYQAVSSDFRKDVERAYDKLWAISSELAQASLSFRTDEGDTAQFQAPSFGTVSLLEDIANVPFHGVDTSYAQNFGWEKGNVESDYLFSYVPSYGFAKVLPGPANAQYLHWVLELDPQHVALVKDESRQTYGTQFIVTAELVRRGEPEKRIFGARRESFVSLKPSEAQSGIHAPFAYSGVFPIVPGSYDVRLVLRNRACTSREESSCRKAYTFLDATVEVPEPSTGPRLSDVVLGYGTEVRAKSGYRAFAPGVEQILPNPRAVYSLGERVEVLVTPSGGRQVRFRLRNRETGELLDETALAVPASGSEALLHTFSLEGRASGFYQVVVELLDQRGAVLDSRQADFDVTPRTAVARPSIRGTWAEVDPEVPGLVDRALAAQYLELGRKKEARERLEQALAANPRLGPAREGLASLLLEQGDSSRAIELLEPVYREVPDRFEVLALLGEAYFRQKELARAVELLEKAITRRRPDSRLLNLLAAAQYQQGSVARAKELLERSLALDPNQAQVKKLLEQMAGSATPPRR